MSDAAAPAAVENAATIPASLWAVAQPRRVLLLERIPDGCQAATSAIQQRRHGLTTTPLQGIEVDLEVDHEFGRKP